MVCGLHKERQIGVRRLKPLLDRPFRHSTLGGGGGGGAAGSVLAGLRQSRRASDPRRIGARGCKELLSPTHWRACMGAACGRAGVLVYRLWRLACQPGLQGFSVLAAIEARADSGTPARARIRASLARARIQRRARTSTPTRIYADTREEIRDRFLSRRTRRTRDRFNCPRPIAANANRCNCPRPYVTAAPSQTQSPQRHARTRSSAQTPRSARRLTASLPGCKPACPPAITPP
jgi:hypothetical protein